MTSVIKSTYFKNKNIHKVTWISLDGTTHNQIDHVLIDRRRHTHILDVRYHRGADVNSDDFLVIVKLKSRLALSKKKKHAEPIGRFNIDKFKIPTEILNYQVKISNRFKYV